MTRITLLLAALSACQGRSDDPDAAAGAESADASDSTSYTGPDYSACVSDAQCEPGSWCTTVPDHATTYCAPPCDPSGDGTECDPDGDLGFEVACLENGRCARVCDEDQVATVDPETGDLLAAAGDGCPDSLECMLSDVSSTAGEDELAVCAGPAAGASGYYGICSHPNVEGTDCPASSSCFGGSYIGLEDTGVCLPWCDDNTCPPVPEGVIASPLCYDAGLDHPVCALLCTPGSGVCPEGEFCADISGFGLCLPEGASLEYY